MSQEAQEANKVVKDGGFDKVIQHISECVVIKAQMQQFMDDLDGERLKARGVSQKAGELLESLRGAQKNNTAAQSLKQAEDLRASIKASRLDAIAVSLEDAVGRFSKVMGDLQHQLVQMDLGSAAISIMQVLLVKVDGNIYALPIEAVKEILKVKKEDVYSVDGSDTISLRGHPLGVIGIGQVIGMPGAKAGALGEQRIVILTDGQKQIGVVVDELLGEESVVFKELPAQVRGIKGLRGASILGDGKVGLIVDAARLILMAGGKE
jgi:chemotaxis protein histidine kinase CheA